MRCWRMHIDANTPLCFSTGFRCGSGYGHGSGFAPCYLLASNFGCDCRGSGHCDGEAIVSPWTASDGAKWIET